MPAEASAPCSEPISAPHDDCQCESQATCTNSSSISGSSTRYGPGGICFIFNAEIEVTCWDGSTVGLSTAIDMGCSGTGDDWGWLDELYEKAAGDIASFVLEHAQDGVPIRLIERDDAGAAVEGWLQVAWLSSSAAWSRPISSTTAVSGTGIPCERHGVLLHESKCHLAGSAAQVEHLDPRPEVAIPAPSPSRESASPNSGLRFEVSAS